MLSNITFHKVCTKRRLAWLNLEGVALGCSTPIHNFTGSNLACSLGKFANCLRPGPQGQSQLHTFFCSLIKRVGKQHKPTDKKANNYKKYSKFVLKHGKYGGKCKHRHHKLLRKFSNFAGSHRQCHQSSGNSHTGTGYTIWGGTTINCHFLCCQGLLSC